MKVRRIGVVLIFGIFAAPLNSEAQVTSTHCLVLSSATSAFWFAEARWAGDVPEGRQKSVPKFRVEEPPSPERPGTTEYFFSRLDTARPIVKEIKYGRGHESEARILHRAVDAIFLVWPWGVESQWQVATINFTARKATIARVSSGVTAVGTAAVIADCK